MSVIALDPPAAGSGPWAGSCTALDRSELGTGHGQVLRQVRAGIAASHAGSRRSLSPHVAQAAPLGDVPAGWPADRALSQPQDAQHDYLQRSTELPLPVFTSLQSVRHGCSTAPGPAAAASSPAMMMPAITSDAAASAAGGCVVRSPVPHHAAAISCPLIPFNTLGPMNGIVCTAFANLGFTSARLSLLHLHHIMQGCYTAAQVWATARVRHGNTCVGRGRGRGGWHSAAGPPLPWGQA